MPLACWSAALTASKVTKFFAGILARVQVAPMGGATGRLPPVYSTPPSARGRPALEASTLRLCRACPARRPEKRALVRAMKALPADGRLLILDETTLRHLPPLRAAWALRGRQAEVRISGKNARRSLFGSLDLHAVRESAANFLQGFVCHVIISQRCPRRTSCKRLCCRIPR